MVGAIGGVFRGPISQPGFEAPAEDISLNGLPELGDQALVARAHAELREQRGALQARRTLLDMCADHWRWQQANPLGYGA